MTNKKVGRPIEKDPLTKAIRTRVTESQYNDLMSIAEAENLPIAEVLRNALDKYAKSYKRKNKQ